LRYILSMKTVFQPPVRTLADLLHRLGDIHPDRVRFNPVPGTATIEDLLLPENKLCELVDDTLVEKAVGAEESLLAIWLGSLIHEFVRSRNLGIVTGEAGLLELTGGTVRAPDVSFISWDRMPKRRRPSKPIPALIPDLAVEVLSKRNTKKEMARKRKEYFRSGVRLVWEINPKKRTVCVYTAFDQFQDLTSLDTLAGDPVLPGFTVPLAQLFAELDRHG
jgi:Uma2 family endonuclease